MAEIFRIFRADMKEKMIYRGIMKRLSGGIKKDLKYDGLDLIFNRYGDFDDKELFRILHPNEVFITEQVGGDNDRDLVEMVLPKTCKPFPHLNLEEQRQNFEDAGFEIVRAEGQDFLTFSLV